MNKKVILVGCGQLGSRHLQAIAKLDGRLKIQVVEPNLANQHVGKMRLSEIQNENNIADITWFQDLQHIDDGSDLAIIATNAKGRAAILKEMVDRGHHRFLVEKMVCQSKNEYESILEVFDKSNTKGWVDCTRRYFPFYQRIITIMGKEKKLIFNATGGNFGLCSNAIHLLDLYWRLSGMSKEICLNGDYLMPSLLSNRRGANLIELSGTIIASTPESSFASISFHPENDAPLLINMTSDNYMIFVNETDNKAFLAQREKNWHWEKFEFQSVYSSDLTSKIASSIFKDDSCDLPTIEESYLLHKELFRIFNKHIHRVTGKKVSICPIT